ncbi:hypothetical protein B296_00010028 [Ensete ventricosum]|uniref:Uncharacterized protein n=1 Tax=Ensete ventricosum TaxID=4639 RepID=A0A426ZSP2_ENSVE|nr:hypothetical protein B296_00010028 [Ensete ventricosum]
MELLSYHIHLILSGDECFVAAASHGADIRWCYPLNSKSARHREFSQKDAVPTPTVRAAMAEIPTGAVRHLP